MFTICRVANIEARKYGTQKGGVDESPPQAKFFFDFHDAVGAFWFLVSFSELKWSLFSDMK